MAGSAYPGQIYPGQYGPEQPQLRVPLLTPTRAARQPQQFDAPNLLATTLGGAPALPAVVKELGERVRRVQFNRSEELRNLPLALVDAPFAASDAGERVRAVRLSRSDELRSINLSAAVASAPFSYGDLGERARRAMISRSDELRNLPLATVGSPFAGIDSEQRRAAWPARDVSMSVNLTLSTLAAPVSAPVGRQDITELVRRVRRVEELQPNLPSGVLYAATQTVLRGALHSPRQVRVISVAFDAPNLLASTLAAPPAAAPFVVADVDAGRRYRARDVGLAPNLSLTTLAPAVGATPFKIADLEVVRRYQVREAWLAPSLTLTTLGVQLAPFITEDLSQRLARFTSRTIDPTGLPLVMFSVGAPFYNPDFVMRQPYAVSRAVEPLGASLTLRGVGAPFFEPDFSVRQPYAVSRAVEPIGMQLALRTVGVPFKPSDQDGTRRVARRVVEDFSNLLTQAPVVAGAPFRPDATGERRAVRRLRPEEFGTPQPILAAQLVVSAYRIYHVPPQDRVRIVELQARIRVIEAQGRVRLLTDEERRRVVELQDRIRIIEAQVRQRILT